MVEKRKNVLSIITSMYLFFLLINTVYVIYLPPPTPNISWTARQRPVNSIIPLWHQNLTFWYHLYFVNLLRIYLQYPFDLWKKVIWKVISRCQITHIVYTHFVKCHWNKQNELQTRVKVNISNRSGEWEK